MEKLTKTNETQVVKTPSMKVKWVYYSNESGERKFTDLIITTKPSVAIIIRHERRIALLKKFSPSTGEWYIELPTGTINRPEKEEEEGAKIAIAKTGLLIREVETLIKGPSLLDSDKANTNYGSVIVNMYGKEQIKSDIIWIEESKVIERVYAQLLKGEYFDKVLRLYMSGHSLYSLMAYIMSKK